jgi:hypothetical protein
MRLQVLQSDSVDQLKEAISKRQGIEPAMQRLIFVGKHLQDGKTLRHYGLGPDMTVYLSKLSFGTCHILSLMVLVISLPLPQWLIIACISPHGTACLLDV